MQKSKRPSLDTDHLLPQTDLFELCKASDAPSLILVIDDAPMVVAYNSEMSHILAEKNNTIEPEVLHSMLHEHIVNEPSYIQDIQRAVESSSEGKVQTMEWNFRLPNGHKKRTYRVVSSPVHFNNTAFTRLTFFDISAEKKLNYVLKALAELDNKGSIYALLDDIVLIASRAFEVSHCFVSLFDTADNTHTVSYFFNDQKQKNISYALAGSPCSTVKSDKKIYYNETNLQKSFPEDTLLQEIGVNAYLGGPLLNHLSEAMGLFVLLDEKHIPYDAIHQSIYELLRNRINLEVERLLTHRKLQLLASFPQQDPNPVLRLTEKGHIMYSNNAGQALVKAWQKQGMSVPANLIKAAKEAKEYHKEVTVELSLLQKTYLFVVVWLKDFDQTNIYATNITRLKRTQKRIENLAQYCQLTKVPNRSHFENIIEQWLERHRRENSEFAVFLLDIDNFKYINDTLGHDSGDKMLQIVADRIKRSLRKQDVIARLGGDEFVVLTRISNPKDCSTVAGKLNATLASPYDLDGNKIESSVSIGISVFPIDGTERTLLLKQADRAMYEVKASGKNGFSLVLKARALPDYHGEVQQNQSRTLQYDPVIELATQQCVGIELKLTTQSFLSENTIHTLTTQLMDDIGDLLKIQGGLSLYLSINEHLWFVDTASLLDDLCRKHQLDPTRITVEIPMELYKKSAPAFHHRINELHDIGVRVGLKADNQLQELDVLLRPEIDIIKIPPAKELMLNDLTEKRFLTRLTQAACLNQQKIFREGVLDKTEHQQLFKTGCHFAKGPFYGKAMTSKELRAWLKQAQSPLS